MQSHILLPGEVPKRYHCLNRVEVVPYSYKSVEYKTREVKENVPVEKTLVEMKPRVKKSKVPVQRVVIDYLPVRKQVSYQPRMVTVKSWDYLPVQKTVNRVEYEQVHKTIVKKKPFTDSKYCRFGDLFKDKYLNDNPVYDMNALSTSGDYSMRDLEWVRRESANESSLIKQNTTEGERERSEGTADFDKNQSTLFTRSAFFSEYLRTKQGFGDCLDKDQPIENK